MKKSLAAINEIIREVERNLGNSQKLKELCDKLEENLTYVEPDLHYHYTLFLVEIYGTKLQQTTVAEQMCREVLLDPRTHVKVQAILRLSYLFSIENKYNDALRELNRVLKMAGNDQPELQMIVINFFNRLMESSRDSNILKGLKSQRDNNFDEALNYYQQEFDCEQIFGSDDNRFFTATTIKRLCEIFQDKREKVDLKRIQQFLVNLEAEMGQSEEVQQRYHDRKKYLSAIIEFIKTHEKRKVKEYDIGLCAKKILAILKLKAALTKMTTNSKGPAEEIKKSINDLKDNKISNPNMLNQFVKKEFEIYKKGNDIILKTFKSYLNMYFQILKQDEAQLIGMNNKKMVDSQLRPDKNLLAVNNDKIHRTDSVDLEDHVKNFQGSYMIKINEHSSGHDKRYFYFNYEDLFTPKMKLYYTSKPSKFSKSDDSYQIKEIKAILLGKMTRAFQRSECKQFQQRQCFALEFKDAQHKNFYVPNREAFENWIQVFTLFYENNKPSSIKSRTEKSIGGKKIEEIEKSKSQNKELSKSAMKKSKKVLFFN